MEKEQKQELGWRVSVLPIPAIEALEPPNMSFFPKRLCVVSACENNDNESAALMLLFKNH